MTLPRSLKLVNTADGYRLKTPVVKELEHYINPGLLNSDSTFVVDADVENDFEIRIGNSNGESVIVRFENGELVVGRSNSGQIGFFEGFGTIHTANLNGIVPETVQVFVDASSIEVFINDGELVMTELVFPNKPYTQVESNGTASISIIYIDSIWN